MFAAQCLIWGQWIKHLAASLEERFGFVKKQGGLVQPSTDCWAAPAHSGTWEIV